MTFVAPFVVTFVTPFVGPFYQKLRKLRKLQKFLFRKNNLKFYIFCPKIPKINKKEAF